MLLEHDLWSDRSLVKEFLILNPQDPPTLPGAGRPAKEPQYAQMPQTKPSEVREGVFNQLSVPTPREEGPDY